MPSSSTDAPSPHQSSPEQIGRDPLFGGLFENLVVVESLKSRLNEGKPANLHFFRDNNGREVDFLVPAECGVVPMEIQSAMTYTPEFESGIRYFQKVSGSNRPGRIVYAGDLEFRKKHCQIARFTNVFPLTEKR